MDAPLTIPDFSDVEAAATRIAGIAVETPLLENEDLNARAGGRVLLKVEAFQRTGSFKYRGATNRILLIPEAERARGVVAFSSGNHAQGVAAAAAKVGIPATIVMPQDAPKAKLEGTRKFGADIVLYDRVADDREAIAAAICAKNGATLVRPFDDAGIVAGQGTVGLEIARVAKARGIGLDAVLAPCSGGGLVSGIALAFSGEGAGTQIVAVEPERYDGMGRSLSAGERVAAPGGNLSIADALMAPTPGCIPFAVAKQTNVSAMPVSDDAMIAAVAYAVRTLKIVLEPGGAAALALVLSGAFPTRGRSVAVVLSGGNADPETLAWAATRN